MSGAKQRGVSRRKFFGVGAAMTGTALAGSPDLVSAARSRGLQDDANGIGPIGGFTNFVGVPIVAGAHVLTLGLYDFVPLDGTLKYLNNGVYSLGSVASPFGTMGRAFSLPTGSKIVRIDTLGFRDVSGQQFWFLYRRNMFSSSPSVTLGSFQSPSGVGEAQSSFVSDIPVAAGDLFIVEIGDTAANNRATGVTIQYIPPPNTSGGPVVTRPSFYPITPARVYDSRSPSPAPGMLAPRTTRVISVKDGRGDNGAVSIADVVPSGATAVTFNVTATATSGPNYLSVAPGDAASVATSTLNWAGGYDIANGGTVKLDANRQVQLFMGDQAGSAHVIVDITGYYL